MSDRRTGDGRTGDPPDPDPYELARDWVTLWQSELTALAGDREAQETWQALIALWAGAAGALLAPAGRPGERTDRHAGPATAAGAASAAAAPDPRDAEIERLAGRLAELELRLGQLERAELERAELDRRGDRAGRRRA